jgi:hypothetical protein
MEEHDHHTYIRETRWPIPTKSAFASRNRRRKHSLSSVKYGYSEQLFSYFLYMVKRKWHIAKVKVTLRLTVSLSWCRAHSGTCDQILLPVGRLLSCFCGVPSLTWGWVCSLQCNHSMAQTENFERLANAGQQTHVQRQARRPADSFHLAVMPGMFSL